MSGKPGGGGAGRHARVVAVLATVAAAVTALWVLDPTGSISLPAAVRTVVMVGASALVIVAVASELDRRWPDPSWSEAAIRLTPIIVVTAVGWLVLADGWVFGFGANLGTGVSLASIGVAVVSVAFATGRRLRAHRPAESVPGGGIVPEPRPTGTDQPHLAAGVVVAVALWAFGFVLALFASLCTGEAGLLAVLACASGLAVTIVATSWWLDRRFTTVEGWTLPLGRVLAVAAGASLIGYVVLASLPASGGCN